MFDQHDFSRLRFLEGTWRGIGPDGKEFFEEYAMVEPTRFVSRRHVDAHFNDAIDGSTVSLDEGIVTSTWGDFTWQASALSATEACFAPVNAPSSFCWEQVAPDTVTVTQRWTGSGGEEQSYTLTLTRIGT